MEGDVQEQRADHPALGSALLGGEKPAILDHARRQPLAHQPHRVHFAEHRRRLANGDSAGAETFDGGGELLLTGGVELAAASAEQRRQYIRDLAARSIAALGIESGGPLKTIPADLIQTAEAHELPLIELRKVAPFVQIAQSINSLLVTRSVDLLRQAGADVVEVSCPNFKYALGAYYLIMPSEASSNLAKFDGVRYGNRVVPEEGGTIEQVMGATRAAGFGEEVKRRIILGTYALSAGYYDAYYGSAQKIRTLVQRDFDEAFSKVDVLISPTSPTTAFGLGEKIDDPLAMYLNDVATIPANLAGIPGISVPGGLAEGLPVGVQFLAPARGDAVMYRAAAALENRLEQAWGSQLWAQAPELDDTRSTQPAGVGTADRTAGGENR